MASPANPVETDEERAFVKLQKLAAESTVKAILAGSSTELHLVIRAYYNRRHGTLHSTVYDHFDVLCVKNTRTSVRWLICNQLKDKFCSISSALLKFEPKSCTPTILKHVKFHNEHATIAISVQLSISKEL